MRIDASRGPDLRQTDALDADEFHTGRFSTVRMIRLSGLPSGMALVPLSKCRDGRGITGPADFTDAYTPDDLSDAVKALYHDIIPMFADGADVFAQLTELGSAHARTGPHSLSDTYIDYFGDSAISVELADDGTFVITDGAHRVWVARQLGITHLPARISYL